MLPNVKQRQIMSFKENLISLRHGFGLVYTGFESLYNLENKNSM